MRRSPSMTVVLAVGLLLPAACATDPSVRTGDASALTSETTVGGTTDDTTVDTTDTAVDTTGGGPAVGGPAVAAPEWGACTDLESAGPELECATVAVPLDHDDPQGETIDIALVRVPALDPDERHGSILINPGGPGGSGVEFVANAGTYFQELLGPAVADHFDLVGFDPRGVGRSSPIECVDDAWLDEHLYADSTPDSAEEEAILDEAETGFVAACQAEYGDRLRLFSTEVTARDMDLLRAALGDDQLTYYGASYGTYLGAVYATLFPDRVRALLLDAAFDPTGESSFDVALTQTVGFEDAFDDWAAWCDADPDCSFRPADGSSTAARWDALVAAARAVPIGSTDGREADEGVVVQATTSALYSRALWSRLALALAQAEAGDGSGLVALTDEYYGRDDDGSYDNSQQAFQVISCASGFSSTPPADPEQAAEQLRDEAPRFGADATAESFDEDDDCDELTGSVEPFAIDYGGTGPVVVVGGLADPATPYRWSEKMAAAMGPSAVLVTYDGAGHTALGSSRCVAEIASTLFADATTPEPGITCAEDEPVPRPDWFDDIPPVEGVEPVDLEGNEGALGLPPTLLYAEALATELPAADAAARYDEALAAAGFEAVGSQPLPDVAGFTSQSVHFGPGGELLVVMVLDAEAVADVFGDQADFLAEFVPAGQTLVLLTSPAE